MLTFARAFLICNNMTWREIIYMCLDQVKLTSDDSFITEGHVQFLISKIRAAVLKQKYSDVKKEIPESNYQTICLDLIETPAIAGEPCEGGSYLRSQQKIPSTLTIGNTQIYPVDYYQGEITFVSRERMRYVGHNKWLQNIIYASLGPDSHLYFKSSNPQYLYMEKAKMTGIFDDTDKAAELECSSEGEEVCDIMDRKFPLEEGLVASVIELTVKYLNGVAYKPKDTTNNAADDLSDIMTFIRKNMKSNLQKQIEE